MNEVVVGMYVVCTVMLMILGGILGGCHADPKIRKQDTVLIATSKFTLYILLGILAGLFWPIVVPALAFYGYHRQKVEDKETIAQKEV